MQVLLSLSFFPKITKTKQNKTKAGADIPSENKLDGSVISLYGVYEEYGLGKGLVAI